jgi:hypothetical protein
MNDDTPWQAPEVEPEDDQYLKVVNEWRAANPFYANADLGKDEVAYAAFMRWAQQGN